MLCDQLVQLLPAVVSLQQWMVTPELRARVNPLSLQSLPILYFVIAMCKVTQTPAQELHRAGEYWL